MPAAKYISKGIRTGSGERWRAAAAAASTRPSTQQHPAASPAAPQWRTNLLELGHLLLADALDGPQLLGGGVHQALHRGDACGAVVGAGGRCLRRAAAGGRRGGGCCCSSPAPAACSRRALHLPPSLSFLMSAACTPSSCGTPSGRGRGGCGQRPPLERRRRAAASARCRQPGRRRPPGRAQAVAGLTMSASSGWGPAIPASSSNCCCCSVCSATSCAMAAAVGVDQPAARAGRVAGRGSVQRGKLLRRTRCVS